jgi:iron complex outermembrane receptor protein
MILAEAASTLKSFDSGSLSMTTSNRWALLCLGAALPVAGTIQAAETTADNTAPTELEQVTVTAERRVENVQDVPISTTVLSNDMLNQIDTSGQDVRVLAFKVPSLNIESSNGRTFPRFYIRGYGNTDFTSFASQPVELIYDDVVQENAALKGFPAFDLADVEVLRGPQGTLFGRNSPAGVVKFESAKPTLDGVNGYVTASDGTYSTANGEGAINIPLGSLFAMRLSFQEQHRDNWVSDPINGSNVEGYNDMAGRGQLLFQPSDNFSALLNVHGRKLDGSARLFRANIIQPGTNDLVAGFQPGSIFTDGQNTQNFSSIGANLRLSWNLGNIKLFSITGYESILKYLTIGDIDGGFGASYAPPFGPGFIPFSVETGGGINEHKQLTQEVRAESAYSGPLNWQAGAYVFYEDTHAPNYDYTNPVVNLNGSQATISDYNIARQVNNAEAVFASLEYAPIESLKIRAGVRETKDNKRFAVTALSNQTILGPLSDNTNANKLNWDASVTYQIVPDVSVYTRAATGFRAPSFGQPSASQAIQVARSESVTSFEVGEKAEFLDHRIRVNADVYWYEVKDQQLTAVGGATNVTTLLNAHQSYGKGAELDIETRPLEHLTLSASGSYNDTYINDPTLSVSPCGASPTSAPLCTVLNPLNAATGTVSINGNPLPQAPRWIGDASGRYDIPLSWGSGSLVYASMDLSYRSETDFFLYRAVEFTGAPLAELGARVGIQWNDGKYELAAFCRNCTNEIRNIYGLDFDNLTGAINDPRVIGGQFTLKF